MRPGKPLVFGQLGAVPMLGLPGNPVSAIVCATLFLLPALARLSGLPGAPPAVVPGIAGADLAANDGRADHLRATLHVDEAGQLVATPFPVQDSAMLRRLARADALVLRAPRAHAVAAGAPIAMIRLDTLGI
jgi:molybdopterin molybdotransferase